MTPVNSANSPDRSAGDWDHDMMMSVRENLWTVFRNHHHGMSPEEFISLLAQDIPGHLDTTVESGDDIAFILAVHLVAMYSLGGSTAFHAAHNCALWAYLHLSSDDMQGLELLDALTTEPGWPPVGDTFRVY
jgi:hypothetical protein